MNKILMPWWGNIRTEILAGVTTFLTMSYIIFVNPGILSAAGVPFAAAATATALGAAVMCICMGLVTNKPIALASGMGINAVLTFSVIGVQQANVPWQVGMSVIFVEGILILILVLTGLREAVMNAIPINLKRAIGVGIGLFITVIGLSEGGIIKSAPVTIVALGDLSQKYVWVTLIGLFAILIFMSLKIKGDLLLGMIVATIAALYFGITQLPYSGNIVGTADFSGFFAPFHQINGKMALLYVLSPALLLSVFAIMLTDFFDTMGTVVALGEQAGFADSTGKVKDIKKILTVDSIAAAVGGLFGASSITTYVESAAGIAEGGRTGLTAIIAGILFALTAFFSPLVEMIGGGYQTMHNTTAYPITAGALIMVGFLMMKIIREIDWVNLEEAFPAFLTVIGIPLTYNISYGIGFGFISYTIIKILHGKFKDIHPLMYIVSLAFVVVFALASN